MGTTAADSEHASGRPSGSKAVPGHDTSDVYPNVPASDTPGSQPANECVVTSQTPQAAQSYIQPAQDDINARALVARIAELTQRIDEQAAQFADALEQARDQTRQLTDAQSAEHATATAALTARHERELAVAAAEAQQVLGTQRQQYERAVAAIATEHQHVLAERDAHLEQSLADMAALHGDALDQQRAESMHSYRVQREQHTELVTALVAMHDKEVGALRHQLAIEQARSVDLSRQLSAVATPHDSAPGLDRPRA